MTENVEEMNLCFWVLTVVGQMISVTCESDKYIELCKFSVVSSPRIRNK